MISHASIFLLTMQHSSANVPHLSTLEQNSAQAYIRFIFCFRLPLSFTYDEHTRILRQGLEATAAEIPASNSVIILVADSDGREMELLLILVSSLVRGWSLA